VVTLVPARFEPTTPMEPVMQWYESHTLMDAVKSGVASLVFILILVVVVRPLMRTFMGPSKAEIAAAEAAAAASAASAAEDEVDEGVIEVGEGETLEAIKARLKPRKSTISADMLDTANTYDDKVAIIRMLVADDSGRVANVLKGMIKSNS
jgi:flagellar M-ring protein FliF